MGVLLIETAAKCSWYIYVPSKRTVLQPATGSKHSECKTFTCSLWTSHSYWQILGCLEEQTGCRNKKTAHGNDAREERGPGNAHMSGIFISYPYGDKRVALCGVRAGIKGLG